MSPITTRQFYKLSHILLRFLLCSLVAATPTAHNTTQLLNSTVEQIEDLKAEENYLCPTDCHCVLAHNTHTPFLHAKCSSLKGLRAVERLEATLPIHSIDLSFLNLTRLSHSLEKLPDLTSIDLSHNDLHEIGHLGRRIKKLNLKHNRINSSKLTKLPQHVHSLNLQHNDITYLPLELTKLNNLQSLELAHNQINCSCETLEVRNWLQERHVFMEHPVKCFYPALYKTNPGCRSSSLWLKDEVQDEEELGKDFMPIDTNTKKTTVVKSSALTALNDVEGSGDLSEMSLPLDILGSSSTHAPAATSIQLKH
ncbi:Protein windpipe, partial [Eumeta japonica]